MATKTKTKPKAQPTPQAAPATLDQVGHRTNPTWSPRDRNPRPVGARDRLAILVRGVTYTLSYSDGPVVLAYGKSVAINSAEFERLSQAVDKIDFEDPGKDTRTIRFIRKFRFETETGEAIELPAIADVDAGQPVLSAADQAARDRLFQGAEHTLR